MLSEPFTQAQARPELPYTDLAHLPPGVSLPRRIDRLRELAYNFWWSWNDPAQRLFSALDLELWNAVRHNPVKLLRQVRRKQINAVTHDKRYLEIYDRVMADFDGYINPAATWFSTAHLDFTSAPGSIAYFSTEFGLHESLPIYAGGLGMLSGDHSKGASDLGLPFVGVGFLYEQGYFRQRISEDGWQEALYDRTDLADLPVLLVREPAGKALLIPVEIAGRTVFVRVWKAQVGRIPVYLMDSNLEQNSPADRELTGRLYSSDADVRVSQEIVLGIGGVRLLRALRLEPQVWHMNEGHSAFLVLERLREKVAAGESLESAQASVCASTVFTTHTPVPAGNETFPIWLMDKYFSGYWDALGLDRDRFIDLARLDQSWGPAFSMPILALRNSGHRNAVSELHGEVSRKMWQFLWPDVPAEDVPIGSITNGVHAATWLARRMKSLFTHYLGPNWPEALDDPALWEKVRDIPDEELWEVRRHLKRKMLAFFRDRAREMWMRHVHPVQVLAAGALLDNNALTIGFARRFATYKRAGLLLRDSDRLMRLVHRPGQPVQFVFAGKAHPADEPGKLLIQQLYRNIKRAEWGGRLVFIEDYDASIARFMVQGVDVWLNTPRRPQEASGTSGQKAAINGVLNLSVLDGWWREGYNGENGWAIGEEIDYDNPDQQDAHDAEALYSLLENEVVPLYYDRDRDSGDVPLQWLRKIKESIRSLAPAFSARRMVKEYTELMYAPVVNGNGGRSNNHR
ncbi:MAG: alpha-glucan family phosphorylase [Chloroflexi bacterium]|nr:alpha-glucan family phosphorylase [Chloroflexota bacterium]